MLIATCAIAGIPPLAGFFSKDEILWRAYQASWAYWLVGVVTAFLTSFYMFRLMYMTFSGEYRGDAETAHAHDDHAHGHGHGHGGVHESPAVMIVPLVILAFLSFFGGFVGVPGSLGGHNQFDRFLGPVFRSSTPVVNAAHEQPGEAAPPEQTTDGTEPETGHATEITFTAISVGAGLLGLFLAWLLYKRSPDLPDRIADSLHSLYSAVAHKYWIDELYAAIFVKPLIVISSVVFWRGIDRGVIDATLDGSAETAKEVSDNLRHMQSGNLRSYAGWIAIGATGVIGYMVWVWAGAR